MERVRSLRYELDKRLLDVLFAVLLLLPWLLVGTLLAVLVRCSSRGPIFYREFRVGRNGEPFLIWKFRTMWIGEERQRALEGAQHTELDLRSFHKQDVDGHRGEKERTGNCCEATARGHQARQTFT